MTRSLDEDSDSDLVDGSGVIVLTSSNSSEPSLPNGLPSKTKCRDALKSINVNIKQFLQCENRPDDVKLFKNRKELIVWTRKRKAFFPRHQLPKGSPLRTLLKHMFN
ncbi:hypothetical protein F25303_1569 [Fusarium sp. NRRL 25303]|nr:hypothetical protein F25303_1569 [Fusarium sp. NRRL 25303]